MLAPTVALFVALLAGLVAVRACRYLLKDSYGNLSVRGLDFAHVDSLSRGVVPRGLPLVGLRGPDTLVFSASLPSSDGKTALVRGKGSPAPVGESRDSSREIKASVRERKASRIVEFVKWGLCGAIVVVCIGSIVGCATTWETDSFHWHERILKG